MARFRSSSWVVRRRRDGDFELLLTDDLLQVVRDLFGQLDDLLEADPDDPSLRRLHPPAYLDDDEQDAAYQLLAGDELRTKRREAIAAVLRSLDQEQLTEGDLWAWLQALNSLRLVVGTRLDIAEDEDHGGNVDDDHPDAPLWMAYAFTTELQHELVVALGR